MCIRDSLKAVEEAVTEELAAKEPSIIISRRPCVMIKGTVHKPPISVDESKCVGCKQGMREVYKRQPLSLMAQALEASPQLHNALNPAHSVMNAYPGHLQHTLQVLH